MPEAVGGLKKTTQQTEDFQNQDSVVEFDAMPYSEQDLITVQLHEHVFYLFSLSPNLDKTYLLDVKKNGK
jgi:hypothetical protein